jgi:uncharacterized protein (DUF1778 family)
LVERAPEKREVTGSMPVPTTAVMAAQDPTCAKPRTYRVSTLRAMSTVDKDRRDRLNLRIAPDQHARLRAAADANGESLTGFVLAAAAERADDVLQRASRVAISSAAFERFVAALDAPVEPMSTLSRYAKQQSPIPAK